MIYNSIEVFCCGSGSGFPTRCDCGIFVDEKLRKNMDQKEVWMKHFRVLDLKPYFENETIKKMCGANIDIMKFAYSTDPHKSLGKYHPNCWCDGCEQISKVIKKNAWRTHLTEEPKEEIIDYVNAILFDDHKRKSHARSSDEDSDSPLILST